MVRESIRHALRASAVAVAAAIVVAQAGLFAAPAAAAPPDPTGPTTLGSYVTKASYSSDPLTTRGWKITWEIPAHTNDDEAWMAVGQWYFNFETGVYYTDHEGWWVYYYGDDDGLTGNNPACFQSWGTGGHCTGAMENLQPGDQLTFTYQWCNASFVANLTGPNVCAWVDMHDGVGNRFLAGEARGSTVEMYTHEIETFGDTGAVEPIIPCTTPVRMLGQQVRSSGGTWTSMTGNQWTFEDTNPAYTFQNVNTSANPATWEACSAGTPAVCPPTWLSAHLYATGDEVGWNGHAWRANWWNWGDQPGTSATWQDLGPC